MVKVTTTMTLDPDLIAWSKGYVVSKRTTLSGLINAYLAKLKEDQELEERLRG